MSVWNSHMFTRCRCLSRQCPSPRITVVFLLYQAAHVAPALVEGLTRQLSASHAHQSDWLEALFMDDASTDGTSRAVEASLSPLGSPAHYRLVANPENLGLAGTLNKALGLVRDTLRPDLPPRLPVRERGLRGLDGGADGPPPPGGGDHRSAGGGARHTAPVRGEAEHRDEPDGHLPERLLGRSGPGGLRRGPLRRVPGRGAPRRGLLRHPPRVAGEDQVLAARLRERGYEIYQAPRLVYTSRCRANRTPCGSCFVINGSSVARTRTS